MHAALRKVHRRVEDPGTALWREFLPALQLWIALLAFNGVFGLAGRVVDVSSPWFEVVGGVYVAAVVTAFCLGARAGLQAMLTRSGFDGPSWWHPLAATAIVFVGMEAYFGVIRQFAGSAWSHGYLDDFRSHDWPLWPAFVLVSVVPALFEELAFRGVIQHRLLASMRPSEANMVQAGMFSVLHMSPIVFPSHFLFGFVLGRLRQSTGSLYPGMAIHALWNAWVLVCELRRS